MDKPESLFDSRIVDRNIAAGLVTREEYEAFLASQEDCGERAVDCDTQFVRRERPDSDND